MHKVYICKKKEKSNSLTMIILDQALFHWSRDTRATNRPIKHTLILIISNMHEFIVNFEEKRILLFS